MDKESLGKLLKRFDLTKINLKTQWLELEISHTKDDRNAAWDMYVEMITRTVTQPLSYNYGDEEAALKSIYELFEITRNILKEKGRNAKEFTMIAVVVLNQIVRPFTSKWHQKLVDQTFYEPEQRKLFREELNELQSYLVCYAKLLADLANVEDLTDTFYSEND